MNTVAVVAENNTNVNPLITPFENALIQGRPCTAAKESIKETVEASQAMSNTGNKGQNIDLLA